MAEIIYMDNNDFRCDNGFDARERYLRAVSSGGEFTLSGGLTIAIQATTDGEALGIRYRMGSIDDSASIYYFPPTFPALPTPSLTDTSQEVTY